MLDQKVRQLVATQNLQGFLLSGGSNRRNEIPYERYYPVVEALKRDFPAMKIAIHTALTDERGARAMESAGVDTAMMDVIGADETIRDVYHLDRPVEDFEATLAALCSTSMEVSPHIVIGLHYGRMLGETNALDIVSRHPVAALVLVVVMPFYAKPGLYCGARTPETSAAFSARRAAGSRTARCCSAAPARPACTSGSSTPTRSWPASTASRSRPTARSPWPMPLAARTTRNTRAVRSRSGPRHARAWRAPAPPEPAPHRHGSPPMSCLNKVADASAVQQPDVGGFNSFDTMQPRAPASTPAEARNGRRVKEGAVPPQGVYLPNDNVLTPQMRSPEYVQMSNAAAITLGIMPGKMHRCGCTRCLNLLLTYPEGCRANCAYCGLARHREADRDYADRNFIRVDWPAVPMQQVVDIVARDGDKSPFHRMCISMITHPRSDADTVAVLEGVDREDRSRRDPGLDPLQPDDHGARRRAAAAAISAPTSSPWRSMPPRPTSSTARAARACSRRTSGRSTGRSCSMRATCSDRRSSAPTSSSAWARPSTRCSRWCSSSWTWAGTATCSASSPSRAR